jgi:voltage-gated potassium channel
MKLLPSQRFRTRLKRLHTLVGGRYWFPHVPLALLLALGGFWVLHASFGSDWMQYVQSIIHGNFHLKLRLLPSLLIGGGMVTMGLGLLWRSRLAWLMAVLLASVGLVNTVLTGHTHVQVLVAYFAFVVACLLLSWRQFDRSSVAASTLFALTSVVMLLLYATFGSYYLGAQFSPPIKDLATALYYSMVTMSTVGYDDRSSHVHRLGHHSRRGCLRDFTHCSHRAAGQQQSPGHHQPKGQEDEA